MIVYLHLQVSLVVNYDLPNNRELYIHRIGRSGRFGRKVNLHAPVAKAYSLLNLSLLPCVMCLVKVKFMNFDQKYRKTYQYLQYKLVILELSYTIYFKLCTLDVTYVDIFHIY